MRTPANSGALLDEVKAHKILLEQQTPLLGIADNSGVTTAEIEDAAKISQNQQYSAMKTPNTVIGTRNPNADRSSYPSTGTAVGLMTNTRHFTPVNNQLGINTPMSAQIASADDSTPMSHMTSQTASTQKVNVKNLFSQIPEPKNQFELTLGDDNDEEAGDANIKANTDLQQSEDKVKDREEIAYEEMQKMQKEFEKKVSEIARRSLPRPNEISFSSAPTSLSNFFGIDFV